MKIYDLSFKPWEKFTYIQTVSIIIFFLYFSVIFITVNI